MDANVEDAQVAADAKADKRAAEIAAYMRAGAQPVAGSIPWSTSPYLNSPLFKHAFAQRSLRRYGHDVPTTYDSTDMSRGLRDVIDLEEAQRAVDHEKTINPAFKAWVERRRLTQYSPEMLEPYRPGTLGATMRTFMVDSGLNLNFANTDSAPATDLEYMRERIGRHHDMEHMVTGFSPTPAGEHALSFMNVTCNTMAFHPELARYLSMPNIFVSAASWSRHCLNYPAGMREILEATELGIRAGKAIKRPLHMVDWEDYLDWPVEEIAADLGFARGPGAAWDITNETCLG